MFAMNGVRDPGTQERSVPELNLSIERPLPVIASSFKEIKLVYTDLGRDIETKPFVDACDHISILFNHLGMAFSFGGKDYIDKVRDLRRASKTFKTLPELVENDVKNGSVRVAGSHTRNLLRVKRGLDLNRCIFDLLLKDSQCSLRDSASKAYDQVFAPYHSWAIKQLVGAGMLALPSKQGFLNKLREDEKSWRIHAEEYVKNSLPIIDYINDLFLSRRLGVNW